MSEARTAIQNFHAASQRIEDLDRQARAARDLPRQAGNVIDRLHISARDHYGSVSEEEKRAGADMQARMRAEYVAKAECERDLKLIDIASELCVIRANLTAIATAAAIELGTLAKNLRHEAEHGPDEPAQQA